MGPSGCGKSTLLDALAGRLASNTRQTGDVLINGRKQQLTYGTSAYLTQEDVLICTLMVREAVYYSTMLQLPNSMSKAEKVDRAERTIRAERFKAAFPEVEVQPQYPSRPSAMEVDSSVPQPRNMFKGDESTSTSAQFADDRAPEAAYVPDKKPVNVDVEMTS